MAPPMPTPQPGSTPMSAEDQVSLQRAAELHRSLARAANLGMANGAGYAIFGVLSLALAYAGWDIVGLILGAVLLGVGFYERGQSRRLLQADTGAPLRLARGELALLGTLVVYGVLGLTVLRPSSQALKQQLGGTEGLGIDVAGLASSINTIWNMTVIGVSLLYQGGMARYFLKRRSDLTRYLEEVPAWARQVVESMSK